ncbi:MAG TPA: glycosyltransferase [Gemmatimonadales bacterium]|nr:glycosyltransferase [Gemmatimonadales bacterium]
MTAGVRISVVIPTYRRRPSLERALRALTRQTVPPDEFEVVVVANGPDDGTGALLATFTAPFALRPLHRAQPGRAGACNQGIAATTGDLVVLLDDDMEPVPDFLAAHRRAHGLASAGVVGAAPVVLGPDASAAAGYIAARFARHLAKLATPGHQFGARDFYSGNFSIGRAELIAAGMFDEGFVEYGNEDLELARRLVRRGVRLVFSPEAIAHQHYDKDFGGLARDTMAKGRTAVLFARRHPEVLPDLKLSTFGQGSRRERLARGLILRLGRVWSGTPDALIALVTWVERRRPARLHRLYSTALDCCYWLGVQSTEREGSR